MDAVCILKRTITTEFKPRNFFKRNSSNQMGPGVAHFSHTFTINPTAKETLV